MKKLALILSIALVGGSLGIWMVPAGSQEPPQTTTIMLFDDNKTDYEKHVRGSGDPMAPGDWHVYVDRLLDPETCDVAAKVVGRFIFVKRVGQRDGWLINDFTTTFADGRITGYGAAKFSDFAQTDPIFALTGGTGVYRGASGELSFATQPEQRCGARGLMSTITLENGP